MKKHIIWLSLALNILTLFCCKSAMGADIIASGTCGSEGENLSWELNEDGLLTIIGTGEMEDYSTSDTDCSPWRDQIVENVVICNGVTRIGDNAFERCTNLKSITLPNSLLSIGYCAFLNCFDLTSITIPANVTSIERYALDGCPNLYEINVSSENHTFQSIDGVLFDYNKSLIRYPSGKNDTSYTIPDGIVRIGEWAFDSCTKLVNLCMPESMTSIGNDAFVSCSALVNVTISANVTTIGDGAFSHCTSLKNITIPNSVVSIGNNAFAECASLTNIVIPHNVSRLGYTVFYNCINLKHVTIPDGVTSIGSYTFYNCKELHKLYVPSSVTSIDSDSFVKCKNVTIICYAQSDIHEYAVDNNIPFLLLEDLRYLQLPTKLAEIGSEAFAELIAVDAIHIPNSVTSIADDAFSGSSMIILAPDGSYTITWAQDHGFDYLIE